MSTPLISVVIPVYKSAESLEELASRLTNSLSTITEDFEVILVNDGSPDSSWEIITNIAAKNQKFIGISLSRNFGQHPAITAGLTFANGEWVVVMDCDLQDRPEEIPNLYYKALEGFEQVVALRHSRQDSKWKKLSSKLFFKGLSFLTDEKLDYRVGNFGIYNRKVISSVLNIGDLTRTFTILTRWVGFNRTAIEVQHSSRTSGNSSYNFGKLCALALQTILGASDKPLRLTVRLGFTVSSMSILFAVWLAIRRVFWGVQVVGWTSTAVLLCFMFGIVIGCTGIVGLYVGRIFDQTKNRPVFIVDKQTATVVKDRLN